jgi:formylglycine-generating enzyme required for sulfatase activity
MRAPLLAFAGLFALAAAAAQRVTIVAGQFESVLPPAEGVAAVAIAAFQLDRRPVTNADFLAFVRAHPEWRRDRIARLFADAQYLSHWRTATVLGNAARPAQPVTRVSWFAAKAYCEAQRARFCGEGALSTVDRENYAVLMRIAFLSSLEASYTTGNLGFRCAAEAP